MKQLVLGVRRCSKLEEVNLKSNLLCVSSGELFQHLVKHKNNLFKVNLELNSL